MKLEDYLPISSNMLQYLDELKALHKLKNKRMAETLVLAEPPASGSEDPEKPLLEESQESDDFEQENQSQEDVLRQKQEEDCLAVMKQHMAETVRFTEVSNSANSSEVGQVLCANSTVEDFAGNYSGELKRAFVFDCVALPEAKKRPWRTVPKHTQETKERLTGVVTYMKRGDFLLFFDGGLKDNSHMCHEVAVIAQRSGKTLCVTDFSLVYNVDQSAPWYRRRGFGCAGNVETLLVLTVDFL